MNLVKQLYPDFPEDRKVVATNDHGKYFKIDYNTRTLYVPTERAIRANLTLIDPFMDSVLAFSKTDLAKEADWENLITYDDMGDEVMAYKLIEQFLNTHKGYVSCDIETRRVEYTDNKVLAIGFGINENTSIVITYFTGPIKIMLQQFFNRKDVTFIWQNGKFDTTRLEYLTGIKARVDEDTILLHYSGINEKRGTHGLKELGAIFLQAPAWDDELNLIRKKYCAEHNLRLKDFTYDMFPKEVLIKYLHFDTIATYRLFFVLKSLARPSSAFIYRKLVEASNAYKQVELNGVYVDIDYLEDREYTLDKNIEEDIKEVNRVVMSDWNPLEYAKDTGAKATISTPFNYKSPKQLKWLLEKVTGRKLRGTSKEELSELFDSVGDQYPVINAISKLRKHSKYMDTYIQGFREVLDNKNRIHGTYNLYGTETGRLSSSEPNMQNIPRDSFIKNLIRAPEGFKLLQLDYSQAELRVLAYLSKDEFLTNVYLEDKDLHDAVATQMFGPDFTKEQRVQAKTINFGVAYGRGRSNIADVFKIPMSEAKALIDNWFAQMPKVKTWINEQRAKVLKNITPSTPLGRERHFVVTYEALNHIQNEYVNFPIQSIASDMTMFSLIEIDKYIRKNYLQDKVRIVINVHDSIVLEVKDEPELIDRMAKACINIMATVPKEYLDDCIVPFKADAEVGYSWGNLSKWVAAE